MEHNPEFPQADEALRAFENAYELAEKSVDGETDAHRAFELATTLADAARKMAFQVAQLRAIQAARIRDQESLSLAGLAGRIRVSKARAQQFVESAAKAREGTDG